MQREDGKERLLTPKEHARVKSAPDALVENLGPTLAHEILGQSIDYRQAWIAMAAVMSHFTGRAAREAKRVASKISQATEEALEAPGGSPRQLQLI